MFPSSFTLHRRKQKTYHSVISDIFDGKLVSSVQVNIFSSTRDIKTTNRFYGIKSVINLRLAWYKIYYIRIYIFRYILSLVFCVVWMPITSFYLKHYFFSLEWQFFLKFLEICSSALLAIGSPARPRPFKISRCRSRVRKLCQPSGTKCRRRRRRRRVIRRLTCLLRRRTTRDGFRGSGHGSTDSCTAPPSRWRTASPTSSRPMSWKATTCIAARNVRTLDQTKMKAGGLNFELSAAPHVALITFWLT